MEYEQRITLDLLKSKRELETRFGVTARAFAYPYGDYGQSGTNIPGIAAPAIRKAASALFRMAFYQSWGEAVVRNYPGMDTFMVRRLEVEPEWDAARLLDAVEGGEDKPSDFSTRMENNPGWIDGWGEVKFIPGRLELTAGSDTTGASSYLDGTYLWKDFDLTLRARLLRGNPSRSWRGWTRIKILCFARSAPTELRTGRRSTASRSRGRAGTPT